MGSALNIRQDYTADDLPQLARRSRDADWSRRLLALSVLYEGGSGSQAASISGLGLQIIRDWVERFNQHGPDGLKTKKAKGREPLLNDTQRKALIEVVEKGPVAYLDGVARWRLIDLVQWLWQEHRISMSRQTLGRELQGLGIVSSRLGRDIMHKTLKPSRVLKKASLPQWQKLLPEQPNEND